MGYEALRLQDRVSSPSFRRVSLARRSWSFDCATPAASSLLWAGAELSALGGSEDSDANHRCGDESHDQPPLPCSRSPAEANSLRTEPCFFFGHYAPPIRGQLVSQLGPILAVTLPPRTRQRVCSHVDFFWASFFRSGLDVEDGKCLPASYPMGYKTRRFRVTLAFRFYPVVHRRQ